MITPLWPEEAGRKIEIKRFKTILGGAKKLAIFKQLAFPISFW